MSNLIAWCNDNTTADDNAFADLVANEINVAVIDLAGDPAHYACQVMAARKANMTIHTSYTDDLGYPTRAGKYLGNHIKGLCLPKTTRACLTLPPTLGPVADLADRVEQFCLAVATTGATRHTDLCLSPATLAANPDLARLLVMFNTVSFAPQRKNPGIVMASTWVAKYHLANYKQYLAVDTLGYYQDPNITTGYQLTLGDDYVAQTGDTWHTIAYKHGLTASTLAHANGAQLTDQVWPGQYIRLR